MPSISAPSVKVEVSSGSGLQAGIVAGVEVGAVLFALNLIRGFASAKA